MDAAKLAEIEKRALACKDSSLKAAVLKSLESGHFADLEHAEANVVDLEAQERK